MYFQRKLRSLERNAESTQRSIEEPDGGRVEEDLNLSLQLNSPNQHIVEAVVEKPDLVSCSADSLEIQGKRLKRSLKIEKACNILSGKTNMKN